MKKAVPDDTDLSILRMLQPDQGNAGSGGNRESLNRARRRKIGLGIFMFVFVRLARHSPGVVLENSKKRPRIRAYGKDPIAQIGSCRSPQFPVAMNEIKNSSCVPV